MKLNEIELDLPYQKNIEIIQRIQDGEKIGYEEAIRKDYECNWKKMRREFQLMTRCMTSMIERIMKPINTEDCWKIMIECVDECLEENYKNLLGVYTIQVAFDRRVFFNASSFDKKRIIINIVLEGVKKLSKDVNFEIVNIEDACTSIINCEYTNEWIWKKPVRLGKKSVYIRIRHDVDEVKGYMVFLENDNLIKENLLFSTIPDERMYSLFLGKIEWVSEREAVLISQTGEKFVSSI